MRRVIAGEIMIMVVIGFTVVRVIGVGAVLVVLDAVFVFDVFAAHTRRSIKLVKVHLVHGHFEINQGFQKRLAHHGRTRKIDFHLL